MKALNRHVERVLHLERKDTHWECGSSSETNGRLRAVFLFVRHSSVRSHVTPLSLKRATNGTRADANASDNKHGASMKIFFRTAFAVATLAASFSPAESAVIGTADSSNGIPFGNNGGGYYYQQVYNSTSFNSSININEITFYNTLSPGGAARPGTFDIYLSYVPKSVDIGTFDTSFFVFPDATFANVFSGSAPAISNSRLDFNLISSFLYDPSKGNLLLTVKEFGLGNSNTLFLDVDRNNGTTNSRFSAFPYDWNQGLVTGFNDGVATTPIPSTWTMLLPALAGLGFLTYRRKSKPGLMAA